MFTAKIKAVAAIFLSVALIGTGGGLFGYRTFGSGTAQADEGGQTPAKPKQNEDALRKQLEALKVELASMRDLVAKQQKKIKLQEDELQRALYAAALRQAQNVLKRSNLADKKRPDNVPLPREPKAVPSDLPPVKAPPGMGGAGNPLEDLRDSLELLQAQVAIKKAHLDAAMVDVTSAKNKLKRIEKLAATRVVGADELESARTTLTAAEAQVRIREAELKESTLRVQQLERRLKANPKAKETLPKQDPQEARLLLLEKKLTDLLKEVQSLRAARKAKDPEGGEIGK
jgi:hypothetical protein